MRTLRALNGLGRLKCIVKVYGFSSFHLARYSVSVFAVCELSVVGKYYENEDQQILGLTHLPKIDNYSVWEILRS